MLEPRMSEPPAVGSCVGFEIRSHLPFRTLRSGGGSPLYVDDGADDTFSGDLVVSWKPRPGNPFHGRLLQNERRYAFWASDAGWYAIDPTIPSIRVSGAADSIRREI